MQKQSIFSPDNIDLSQRRFVVLDRDGTINVERHYLSDPDQVELIPEVIEGLSQMRRLGLGLVVVTNQSAIGRGFFDQTQLDNIHDRLLELLDASGVSLDGIYACPHKPDDNCGCRKPKTGLLELASQELGFDPESSFVIGDKTCDIELGKRSGAITFLVRTGYGAEVINNNEARPDYIVNDMLGAAQIIGHLMVRDGGEGKSASDERRLIESVQTHLAESARIKLQIAENGVETILEAARMIAGSFRLGGKLLLCGNGGSAADCQHMAAEFVSRLTKEFERPGLPAIALTTDTSFLTAFTNDCGFNGVFERQVQAFGKPDDVLIGISTSGNSANVLRAINKAKSIGLKTIGVIGEGGEMAKHVDCSIIVPSRNTQIIQECMLTVEHILCELVECDLFGKNSSRIATEQISVGSRL